MIPSVVAAEVAGALRDFLATGFGPSNPALTSVRLATMHRVKGLEFDRVVMASVNADLVPLPAALDARGDPVERESAETEERALAYVAATRAKKELLVLSHGAPSRLLQDGP